MKIEIIQFFHKHVTLDPLYDADVIAILCHELLKADRFLKGVLNDIYVLCSHLNRYDICIAWGFLKHGIIVFFKS